MRRLETSRVQKFVILFTISFYLEVEIIKSKASNTSITSKTSRPEWLQDVQRIRDSHTSKTLTSLISKWSTDYFFTFSVWRGKEKKFPFHFLLFFSESFSYYCHYFLLWISTSFWILLEHYLPHYYIFCMFLGLYQVSFK